MPTLRILLIGGHGKISQLLTPILLSKSCQVTSLIRHSSQLPTIETLQSSHHPGSLSVLVHNIEECKTQAAAQSIIDSTKPDYIVWSAGAGGKGGAERTFAVDKDACIAFIRAAAATETVSGFLVVSYIGSRQGRAPWWSDADWASTQEINNGALKNYHVAKLAADQAMTALARKRGDGFAAISLRPGTLTDDEGEGKVQIGKIAARGKVRRGDVARVAAALLEKETRSRWLDLLEGNEQIKEAVEEAVTGRIDCVQGEDVDAMIRQWT